MPVLTSRSVVGTWMVDVGRWMFLLLVLPVIGLAAEEPNTPPKPAGVRITFLPPPLEGTLSVGVYDKTGKLVRTLHADATEKDFTAGLNGFITNWDGKDDGGQPVPAGKYHVRGFAVAELEVEGIAYHCNDWVTEAESPRVQTVASLRATPGGELLVQARGVGGTPLEIICDREGRVRLSPPAEAATSPLSVDDGRREGAERTPHLRPPLTLHEAGVIGVGGDRVPVSEVHEIVAGDVGRDRTFWLIGKAASRVDVMQYSMTGELQRRMEIEDPTLLPWQIVASKVEDAVYLLERGPSVSRLRGLRLDPHPAPAVEDPKTSVWKTFLSKTIRGSDTFEAVADKLGRAEPVKPIEKFTVKLVNNPLLKDEPSSVDVAVAHDAKGAYLKTADGLLLARLTETPHLKWTAMTREGSGKLITFFQSDGAVVEEFRLRRVASMMGFDAGEYEWSPPAPR